MSDSKDVKGDAPVEEEFDAAARETRQNATYGGAVGRRLKTMRVFIVGMRGLGVETAKNLILSGPKAVTVHDDNNCAIEDLGCNFYLQPEDCVAVPDKRDPATKKITEKGRPIRKRGEATFKQLIGLNPGVNMALHTGEITNEFLHNFDVVVFADHWPLKSLYQYNAYCRANGIKFIAAHLTGVAGSLFVDFGPKHRCFDTDGALERNLVLYSITTGKNATVQIDGERPLRHLLHDDDLIAIQGVVGMEPKDKKEAAEDHKRRAAELDKRDPEGQLYYKTTDTIYDINSTLQIKTIPGKPDRFHIGDTTQLTPYINGGTATQVKLHTIFNHASMHDNTLAPRLNHGYAEFMKGHGQATLHVAQLALWQFQHINGKLPDTLDQKQADQVVALAKSFNELNKSPSFFLSDKSIIEAPQPLDEQAIRKIALFARTEITPMAALFGGIVAQEIVKQAGKYTPLSQWMHFDALEMLPNEEKSGVFVPAKDSAPLKSRYDHQIALFGKAFQDKLAKQKIFLVGCGALGCEYLKAIACSGLGLDSKQGGEIHITDNDTIELSNLSRQFLFRQKHVGKPKAVCAAGSAAEMNSAFKDAVTVHQVRVGQDTENQFTDAFWKKLDFVVNALDNIMARQYTDGKCVLHMKPLFESGTLGTAANTVVVLPGKTSSYSQGVVAGEGQGIAMCTLTNFPALPLHCIEWGRLMFGDHFVSGAQKAAAFLEDPKKWLGKAFDNTSQQLDEMKQVKYWLELSKNPTIELCTQLAFDQFHKQFRDKITDLTTAYPENARVIEKSTGADMGPFWRGAKRFPQNAGSFNGNNPAHLDYVYHGACLYASIFGIPTYNAKLPKGKRVLVTPEQIKAIASKLTPAVYKAGKVDVEEKEKKKDADEDISADEYKVLADLQKWLEAVDPKAYGKIIPVDFEKDDDTNHHIDWITAATNLRAWNYHIAPSERSTVHITAGRIIPAIATTTACITGFVGLEIYKHVLGCADSAHRQATIELGVNAFVTDPLQDKLMTKPGTEKRIDTEKSVEGKEVYMDVKYQTAPKEGFDVWTKTVVQAGDLSFAQLVEVIEKMYPGVTVESVVKKGVTDKEVAEGKGINLWAKKNIFEAAAKLARAQLPTTSHALLKAKLQKDIDNFEAMEKKKLQNVLKRYIEAYGPLITPERSYILLDANCVAANGESVLIPPIVYIFKDGEAALPWAVEKKQ